MRRGQIEPELRVAEPMGGALGARLARLEPVRVAILAISAMTAILCGYVLAGFAAPADLTDLNRPSAIPSDATATPPREGAALSTPTPDIVAMPADPALPRLAAVPMRAVSGIVEMRAALDDPCAPEVVATPMAGALVALEVLAPCDAGARIDVLHGPLHVAGRTGEDGTAVLDVPALQGMATVAVLIGERDAVMVEAALPDFERYARTVLYWNGRAGMQLHAFEDGATYGADGHVSTERPHSVARAMSGRGGFVSNAGDAGIAGAQLATAYTAAVGRPAEISIEVPVTEANCGREVEAGLITVAQGAPPRELPLSLTMPPCDAVGTYVQLGDPRQSDGATPVN